MSTAAGERHDIRDRDDIRDLLVAFYGKAFEDDLIGFVFTDITHMELEPHLPIMCDFWETVLFRAGLYKRNALDPHFAIHKRSPLLPEQFARWLELWNGTLDELFEGEIAEHCKVQAERIAGSMSRRLNGESGSEFVSIARRAEGSDETDPADHR